MPDYKYTALDSNGTTITGVLPATSEPIAKEMLLAMQLTPVYLQESSEVSHVKPTDRWKELSHLPTLQPVSTVHDLLTFKEGQAYETIDTHTPLPALSPHLEKEEQIPYHPLSDTLQLYAGWLLAWYGLVYCLGYFERTRQPIPSIPYVYGLLYSPLILTLTLVCFLYLLYSRLHTALQAGVFVRLILGVACTGLFVLIRTLV